LKFSLSNSLYIKNIAILKEQERALFSISKKAGTGNPKFEKAWERLHSHLQRDIFEQFKVTSRFDIRAIAIALNANKELRSKIKVTPSLLNSISGLLKKSSSLFNDSLYQYFLTNFDEISDPDTIGKWLQNERELNGYGSQFDKYVLRSSGPVTLATDAIKNNISFVQQTERAKIDGYASGQFLRRALSIYYVEQLNSIPENLPHALLDEVSIPAVYNSKYDDEDLIGHKVLNILLKRAPRQGVHESWQNTIISIAGDPRTPKSHPKYLKWWSHVPEEQIKKVRGWLSKLDLKLFLEALEAFSESSLDSDMMRMFPSRKKFLEGMHDAGAIVHTKLYLSRMADRYIRRNYKPEHIPEYSLVQDGERSIIYAELTHGHMIEGSHNCQIWFYKSLSDNALVLHYGKQTASYTSLTGGLNRTMSLRNNGAYNHFTHTPSNFNWQNKSVNTLKEMGVKIQASDVLVADDYKRYKRIYGVG
tara:strand:+ start:1468 stop:2895 length:1428 start_codon:yes stop_codon:yes gene_type:complete